MLGGGTGQKSSQCGSWGPGSSFDCGSVMFTKIGSPMSDDSELTAVCDHPEKVHGSRCLEGCRGLKLDRAQQNACSLRTATVLTLISTAVHIQELEPRLLISGHRPSNWLQLYPIRVSQHFKRHVSLIYASKRIHVRVWNFEGLLTCTYICVRERSTSPLISRQEMQKVSMIPKVLSFQFIHV